jgi:putative PIN family toxin of toxin-antitoxin system
MIDAVLDTNVVVSALLRVDSTPGLVLRLALDERIRCFISEGLFAEYEAVCRRPELKLSAGLTTTALRRIRRSFTTVSPARRVTVASDPSDNKVLECALEARVDYIVTGNLRHFPSRFQSIRITAPRDFLTIFESEL